jgi:hypothetical protein
LLKKIGKGKRIPLPPGYGGLEGRHVTYLERMTKSALRFLAQASSE